MTAGMAFEPHRSALQRLAEITGEMLELAFARAKAAEGKAFFQAAGVFADLSRGMRLTLALDMRLLRFGVVSAQTVRTEAQARPADAERNAPERREASGYEEPSGYEYERERETESDGYPMDPLGRAEALEAIIARAPDLDPDHRVTAQIIHLKTSLNGSEPPPLAGPAPALSPGRPAPAASSLGRPLNRAERRRQRRGSG